MSLGFLLPAALAGLVALLLPLLLHLARRREARRLDFAAMRWLPPGRSARRRVRIEERLLLLLRLLLLAAAVLWLAQPVLRGATGGARSWVAAWPGVDPAAARAAAAGADRAVWLASGFPPLADAAPGLDGEPASLLRELDARLPIGDGLAVLLPDPVPGLDAAPLRSQRAIDFRVVEGQPLPSPPAASPRRVLLLAGEGPSPAMPYLRAALAAWRGADGAGFELLAPDAPTTPGAVDAVVSIGGDDGLPAALASLPRIEVVQSGGDTMPVDPAGRVHRLGWPADGSVPPLALDPGFPAWLAARLAPVPVPTRAAAATVTASASLLPPEAGGRALALERELTPWLALATALLFALERLLATGARLRRQA